MHSVSEVDGETLEDHNLLIKRMKKNYTNMGLKTIPLEIINTIYDCKNTSLME